MLNIEKVSENLFDKIRSRFTGINIGDENAKATVDPTKARFFNFDFTYNGENYGNITFSLVDEQAIKVYFDQEIDKGMDAETRQAWYNFLKDIRLFAKRHMMTFDIRDIAKSGLNIADLKHANKDADVYDSSDIQVTEGKLYGTTRSSYQNMESVRIIARHSKPVDEQQLGARARNIRALYIENSEGERFKLPEGTTLNGARAYARHVMNGGQVHDEFGQHIGQMIKELADLKLFARNCRGRTFEDAETMAMVEAAVDHYGTLHRDLFSLRGQKGYTNYKESWTATESLDNVDLEALKEKFTRKVFDERLMDALPVVQRAYEERKNRVGEEFEQWANSVIEEDDDDSVFANSPNPEQSDFDFSGGDAVLDKLFTENGFQFKFLDGKYYFESNQEVERAKDIIAAHDPKMKFPPMGVYNYGYGTYGSTTNDYETGTYSSLGMEESVQEDIDRRGFLKGMGAAAVAGAAGSATAQSNPVDVSAELSRMTKDDPRIQHNKDINELAKVYYDLMVAERGQPMDRIQQRKWLTIARNKATADLNQPFTTNQSSNSPRQSGAQRVSSEYRSSRGQFEESQGVAEGMFGLSDKEKGSIMNVVEKLSDIPGMWDHKAQTFTDQGMEKLESVLKNNKKYIKYAVNLTADDFEADLEESKDLDSIKRLAGLAK